MCCNVEINGTIDATSSPGTRVDSLICHMRLNSFFQIPDPIKSQQLVQDYLEHILRRHRKVPTILNLNAEPFDFDMVTRSHKLQNKEPKKLKNSKEDNSATGKNKNTT